MGRLCPFCDISKSTSEQIYSYRFWNLFLHGEEKRNNMRKSAGFLALRRHEPYVIDATDDEWGELREVIADAAERLCVRVGLIYTGQEVVGFNRGADAGQTVDHAHVHILPVAEEDPARLKGRVGIGAAFEALHRQRMK